MTIHLRHVFAKLAYRTGLRSPPWSIIRSSEVLAAGVIDRRRSVDKDTAELNKQLRTVDSRHGEQESEELVRILRPWRGP